MGRILRKKTVNKKKKNKKVDENTTLTQSVEENGEKKPLPFTGFSKESPKKPQPTKSKAPVASPVFQLKKPGGYLDKSIQFLREVKFELKKVTWPARRQTIGSTIVVIILVMIISLFLGMVDFGLSNLVRIVLH